MYNHISRDDRAVISNCLRRGKSYQYIADCIRRNKSTVWREVQRNKDSDGIYQCWSAERKAKERRQDSKKNQRLIENDSNLGKKIEKELHPLVSPEVIAHLEGISHQTIYSWIYRSRPDLKGKLPQRGRKRRKYGSKREKKQGWRGRVKSIEERPESDISWEGDTVEGKGRARLLTHVERDSLYTLADLIPNGTADAVHAKVKEREISDIITYDRGSEFALWEMIERDTGAEVFFAHPHHPWERGKNENTNGRFRRVFPKKFDFSTIEQRDLDQIVWKMNHTPRKSLGWRKPCELYGKCCTSS